MKINSLILHRTLVKNDFLIVKLQANAVILNVSMKKAHFFPQCVLYLVTALAIIKPMDQPTG